MINDTELFNLCKQVYEATGWKKTGKVWYSNAGKVHDIDSVYVDGEVFDKPANVPLYTSDYILEKLPKNIKHDEHYDYLTVWSDSETDWNATYELNNDCNRLDTVADTPLKALLKLTLKLHKNGELK